MTPRPSLGESFAAFWPVVSGIRPTSWPLTKTSVPLVSSSLPLSRVRTSARVSSSSSKPSKASAPSSAVGVIVFSLGSLFPAPPAAAFSFFATDFPAGTDLVDFFFLLATGESSAAAATVRLSRMHRTRCWGQTFPLHRLGRLVGRSILAEFALRLLLPQLWRHGCSIILAVMGGDFRAMEGAEN